MIPQNYVEVSVNTGGSSRVDGYVDEFVLNLFAEGKIKNVPVLTVEADRLVVEYVSTDDIIRLKAFPTADQLAASMPEDSDDIDSVIGATESLGRSLTVPIVPLAGVVHADPNGHADT